MKEGVEANEQLPLKWALGGQGKDRGTAAGEEVGCSRNGGKGASIFAGTVDRALR